MRFSHNSKARFTDLSSYGAGFIYMFGFGVAGAIAGALLGWLVQRPGDGAALGALGGLLTWVGLLVAARRSLGSYVGRRREDDPSGGDEPTTLWK